MISVAWPASLGETGDKLLCLELLHSITVHVHDILSYFRQKLQHGLAHIVRCIMSNTLILSMNIAECQQHHNLPPVNTAEAHACL